MTQEKLQELNDLAAKIKRNEENVAALKKTAMIIAGTLNNYVKTVKVVPMNANDYALDTLKLSPAFFPHIIRALENYAEEIDTETSIARVKLKHA
jgi:uncharacterized membrane-anchored protein